MIIEVPVIAAGYDAGFTWSKMDDYTEGTIANSTIGNPNLDQLGNPAWSYETFIGPSENWDSSSQMVWLDGFRWGSGGGFTNISQWDQNTQLNTNWNNTGLTSLVRWSNPTGGTITVDLTGRLRTFWGGQDWVNGVPEEHFTAAPADVRVVLGYYDLSAGSSSLLLDNMYISPISEETICYTWGECPYIDTYLDFTFTVDDGDSLFWTTIALDSAPGKNRWITTNDAPVAITIVPEPVSSALFIAGASVLGIRRFRNKKQSV